MLTIKNLSKSFNEGTENEVNIFNNFNLEVEESEFVAVLGSNGCGKSTLFNVLVEMDAAIATPIAGTTRDVLTRPVAIAGKRRRLIAIPALFMTLTNGLSARFSAKRSWNWWMDNIKRCRIRLFRFLMCRENCPPNIAKRPSARPTARKSCRPRPPAISAIPG